ncbi:MAG: hypothetical protein C0606_15470 [Hyphomicrobiales bacterium]|nr:MAG: hypothetical protein C0606_15470 [Hyphomicrobiales bacterium]
MSYSLINILFDAQNGDAVSNFAKRFGLGFDDTERVMEALMPAYSRGFKLNTSNPLSLANFLDVLGQDRHIRYWRDPTAAFTANAFDDGAGILRHIFGSDSLVFAIAREVAKKTGVPYDTVEKMMPPIAAMLVGGIAEELPRTSFGELIDAYLDGFARGRPDPEPEPEPLPLGPSSFFDAVGTFFEGLSRGRTEDNETEDDETEAEPEEEGEAEAEEEFEADAEEFSPNGEELTGEDLFGSLLDAGVELSQSHVSAMSEVFERFWDISPQMPGDDD